MKELLTGNEAIARGAYEAGVVFASAYPGTPSTEILENVAEKYKDIYAEWAPNEKVAMEAAIGASFAGARALATMKHVGVNVAADPLFTFAYTGVTGGMVLVSADDPGQHSSQDEQDNRNYAKFARVAMLEPSNSQEAKDYVKAAYEISEAYDTPVMLRVTTRVCHSKSIVELGERDEVGIKPFEKQWKFDPVPAVSRILRVQLEDRLRRLEECSNNSPLNRVEWNADKKIGIVTSGIAYEYAKDVFGDTASYLKLGMTFPLPMEKIKEFADSVETVYVIEELDPYIETAMKAAGIPCVGKEKVPSVDELNPDIVRKAFFGTENEVIDYDKSVVAKRPPTLCAGCPHRGIFVELEKRRSKNVVITSDIGCYSLGPKDIAICMGGGFSIAHGAQRVFNMANSGLRVVGLMGDSTFFHSGLTSLLEAAYNKSNALYIIMDNRITGMTGHQQNPGSGYTLMGERAPDIDFEQLVRALGIQHVRTINPLDLAQSREALDWGLSFEEPAVLITRWPCVLKRLSSEDMAEFKDYKAINEVDPDKCIGCRLCVKTGCPALEYHDDTKKVTIDISQCVGCDVCAQVCPKSAIHRKENA